MSLSNVLQLLQNCGAPPRLQKHGELVAEVASELADVLIKTGARIDRAEVVAGAALHDIGKIEHPSELAEPGRLHELAGERMLLAAGVSQRIAKFCRTHGLAADQMSAIEDLVVAVADKIWRGVRRDDLESALIKRVAEELKRDTWDVFALVDDALASIASKGDARLARQVG